MRKCIKFQHKQFSPATIYLRIIAKRMGFYEDGFFFLRIFGFKAQEAAVSEQDKLEISLNIT